MENSMTSSISSSSTPVCLSTLAELERLTTESTLVNLAFLRSGERYTEVFKLMQDICRSQLKYTLWYFAT